MGLPVWTSPTLDARADALKADATAQARSPIRRRVRPSRSPRSRRMSDDGFLVTTRGELVARSTSRANLPPVPEIISYMRANEPANEYWNDPAESERDGAGSRSRPLDRYYRAVNADLVALGEQPLPPLTPNFAPAAGSRNGHISHSPPRGYASSRNRPTYHRLSPRSQSSGADRATARTDSFRVRREADNEDESSGDEAMAFHRPRRRRIADGTLARSSLRRTWSPFSLAMDGMPDGLGDRQRSVSPSADYGDNWNLMLNTVAPDPLAPTAESSFASAAASASFSNSHTSSSAGSSNSNSATSSRTHLTVPSRQHSSAPDNPRVCDSSEDENGSETEEDEDVDTRLDPLTSISRSARFRFGNHLPSLSGERSSLQNRGRSENANSPVPSTPGEDVSLRDTRQPLQSFASHQLQAGLDGPANTEDDIELRDARAILERLSRRGDLGEDFWASLGLIRSFSD